MPPEFLNSREDAIVIWAIVVLGYVVHKDPRGIGRSGFVVLRSFFQWKLLLLFGSALLYCAAVILMAMATGLWHLVALKATIVWFVGTGVLLVGDALTRGAQGDPDFVRRLLRRLLAFTIVVEFVVSVYALPLAFEIVLVFVAMAFAGMQALVLHDASYPLATRKVIDGVLTVVAVIYIGYFVARVFSNLDRFLTRDTPEDFLVGPVLTVALIPFLYAVAWLSRREQQGLRRRICTRSASPA